MAGGSYDYKKMQFKTGGRTDRLDYLVSVSDLEIDGYRAQSRAVNRQATGRFDIDLGNDRSFLTVVNFTDQPLSDDAGGLTRALARSAIRAPRFRTTSVPRRRGHRAARASGSCTRHRPASTARSKLATTTRGAISATCCPCKTPASSTSSAASSAAASATATTASGSTGRTASSRASISTIRTTTASASTTCSAFRACSASIRTST